MIKLFIIYFLITGIILHYQVTKFFTLTKEEINKLSEKKKSLLEEINSMIYVHFGNINILPYIQLLALLLGWILLPYSIITTTLEKIGIKIDKL